MDIRWGKSHPIQSESKSSGRFGLCSASRLNENFQPPLFLGEPATALLFYSVFTLTSKVRHKDKLKRHGPNPLHPKIVPLTGRLPYH